MHTGPVKRARALTVLPDDVASVSIPLRVALAHREC